MKKRLRFISKFTYITNGLTTVKKDKAKLNQHELYMNSAL